MSVFDVAVDDLFGDPNLARDAIWRAGGTGPATTMRIIGRRPDRIGEFGETRVVVPAAMFDLRIAEAPSLAGGDTLEIDGTLFIVQGEPVRDAEQLVWTVEARPA